MLLPTAVLAVLAVLACCHCPLRAWRGGDDDPDSDENLSADTFITSNYVQEFGSGELSWCASARKVAMCESSCGMEHKAGERRSRGSCSLLPLVKGALPGLVVCFCSSEFTPPPPLPSPTSKKSCVRGAQGAQLFNPSHPKQNPQVQEAQGGVREGGALRDGRLHAPAALGQARQPDGRDPHRRGGPTAQGQGQGQLVSMKPPPLWWTHCPRTRSRTTGGWGRGGSRQRRYLMDKNLNVKGNL